MPLSDVALRNSKPAQKPYKLPDGGGLYVLVTPNGRKYWRLKYRFAGKEKVLALGVYPDVRAGEAREQRNHAKRMLKEGRDPNLVRKQKKLSEIVSSANTFGSIAREWVEQQRTRWTSGHADRVLESLDQDVFATLEPRPISEVTAAELLAVLRKVEARGAIETAHRILQRCGAIFRYGISTVRCERNPAADLRGALKPIKRANHAALPASELPHFLRKLEAYDGQLQTKLALKLLLLTFVRSRELRGAAWSEFDFEQVEWRIPSERMKMGTDHIVPLSRQAIEVLEQLKLVTGKSRFVFPNRSKPRACMSENTMLYALYRMGYHSRATAHGFRATASTILNEQGWRADAIERQLAHIERNRVRAAYNRSEYLDERRRMMQAWADYLDRVGAGAKVTPIKAA